MDLEELAEEIHDLGKDFGGDNAPKSLAAHISKKPDYMEQRGGKAYLTEWL